MSGNASQVRLSVGGRPYTVACTAGEEDHVKQLAAVVDEKMAQLGAAKAPQASQNLLFAALLLADDLHEKSAELARASAPMNGTGQGLDASEACREEAEAEKEDLLNEIRSMRADADSWSEERERLVTEIETLNAQLAEQTGNPARILSASPDDPALAPALEHFAEMLEKCADGLEGRLGSAAPIH